MKRMVSGFLSALILVAAAALPAEAAYQDFDAITSHVATNLPQKLQITRPSGDIYTSAANYYLTGSSNPAEELTVNGETVTGRGAQGSWGYYAALSPGENQFTFKNGSASQTVTISQGDKSTVATTVSISKQTPMFDVAVFSGSPVTLTCVAPAGASVIASVGGREYQLTPDANASEGIPVTYRAEFTMPAASGTQELGQVTYSMVYRGKDSSALSNGGLYAAGDRDALFIEMKDTSSTVFKEASLSSDFITCAKKGAVDSVRDIRNDMYQLGTGGWIQQSAARPLTGNVALHNEVSSVTFSADADGEQFIFAGTAKPIFTAYQNAQELYVRLTRTSGFDSIPAEDSKLFSHVEAAPDGDGMILRFILSEGRSLWGYVVEYDEQGNTIVYCKYPPVRSSGDKPLKGVTVAVDPGHGGEDSGALGIGNGTGPKEKDITLDTAIALKKRLESLGASVVMTREKDSAVSLSDRMWVSQQHKADFFIALHGNSLAENSNGLKPAGVETYYYENIAQPFAAALASRISSGAGRVSRGAKYSNFKVTLATYAPAVLVEMGFLTHPEEYDAMCGRRGIFNTVNAIADGILDCLS